VAVELSECANPVPAVETRTRTGDMLGHRRLQVEARKWYAAKLAPKKYGDRLELGGELGFKTVSDKPLTEEEWAARHAPQTGEPA
jgi:hypothetical protein